MVSLGKPTKSVSVPNVVGKKEADALSALQSAGLTATIYRQADPKVAKGVVISQSPPSGSKTVCGRRRGHAHLARIRIRPSRFPT